MVRFHSVNGLARGDDSVCFGIRAFNDNIVGCGSVIMYYSGTIYLDLILSGTD